ncbi:hypothetical protein AAE478_008809 [Parahypoxylon ruwenzoriense]
MGSKRPADNDGETVSKKRRNQRFSGSLRTVTSIDPTYGQRGVFGNLEYATTVPTGDSDLDCEDDTEALAYLRSVREQASTIPHILVARKAGPQPPPQTVSPPSNGHLDRQHIEGEDGAEEPIDRNIYQDGRGDFRGYYEDGAYVAYPLGYFDEDEQEEEEEEGDEDYNRDYDGHDYKEGEDEEGSALEYDDETSPDSSEGGPHNSNSDEIRDAYFTSLTNQFLALRQILQTDPPDSVLSSLPKSNPIKVGDFGRRSDTFSKWSGRLRGTDPLPAQIAGMHKDCVIRLLRVILGGKFLRKKQELRERTSRWIWALLARLPDKGELDHQEIGWIRELGKRAILMMVSLAEMEVLKEHYDVGDGSTGSQDGEVDVDEGIDEDLSPEEFHGDDYFEDNMDDSHARTRNFDQAEDDKADKADASTNSVDAEFSATCKEGSDNQVDIKANNADAEGVSGVPPSENETGELSDVEMQIDSEEEEDGEVSDTPQQREESTADIETAKARLLAQLGSTEDTSKNADAASAFPEQQQERTTTPLATDEEEAQKERERLQRTKINERATLNMILTVAGEFFGQRDLLEFRDPFGGLEAE